MQEARSKSSSARWRPTLRPRVRWAGSRSTSSSTAISRPPARARCSAHGTATKGSAGYVAIERVAGALNGRSGTFVLQHSATIAHGVPQPSITVVPDSGTDGLAGIAGRMTIEIADGKHSYDFEYTIAETP